jgi:hypothetical protein
MTASVKVQRDGGTQMSLGRVIGSCPCCAQSPAIRARGISLTSVRSTVVLGRVVYRRGQRKIFNATVTSLRGATTR